MFGMEFRRNGVFQGIREGERGGTGRAGEGSLLSGGGDHASLVVWKTDPGEGQGDVPGGGVAVFAAAYQGEPVVDQDCPLTCGGVLKVPFEVIFLASPPKGPKGIFGGVPGGSFCSFFGMCWPLYEAEEVLEATEPRRCSDSGFGTTTTLRLIILAAHRRRKAREPRQRRLSDHVCRAMRTFTATMLMQTKSAARPTQSKIMLRPPARVSLTGATGTGVVVGGGVVQHCRTCSSKADLVALTLQRLSHLSRKTWELQMSWWHAAASVTACTTLHSSSWQPPWSVHDCQAPMTVS
mmetsp:Transcript_95347/g.278782  ORF Transcript_95347/g.278782 Transcript_95347/m.278782 type:complete len:294 (+) Transcript_95347:580-1461(+)